MRRNHLTFGTVGWAATIFVSVVSACPGPPEDGPEVELAGDVDAVEIDVPLFEVEVETAGEDGLEMDSDIEVTAGACAPGAAGTVCDDANRCTDDVCRPDGTCANTPNIAVCDDGDSCTSFDRCIAGSCSGTTIDCDDGESCTGDACLDGACVHAPLTGVCDDGSLCTTSDHCDAGACVGAAVVCAGGGPCGQPRCEPRTGCMIAAVDEGAACDDGNACTLETTCVAGVCRGSLLSCGDDNPCSDDYCDPLSGCGWRPNRAPCDDQDRCTVADVCTAGVCVGAPAESCCGDDAGCDDGDACTDDRCEGPGCVHVARACDDGDACTRDGCEAGLCVSTAWAALDEAGQVIEDFEGGLGAWSFTSTNDLVGWRASASWAADGGASLYCGDAAEVGYDHGATRAVASLQVLVPPGEPELHLTVKTDVGEHGSCLYDALTVTVDGAVVGVVCGSGEGEQRMSLAEFEGREVELALVFDTVDDVNNGGQGIWVDRLRLTANGCR